MPTLIYSPGCKIYIQTAGKHGLVDVSEDLGQRQVGLGDGDIAPHPQSDLIPGERLVLEHPQHLARAPLVHS